MRSFQDEQLLELELKIAVGFIFFIAFLFLIVTLIKRGLKIRKNKNAFLIQQLIDNLAFKILFSTDNLEACIKIYQEHKNKKLFKKLLIKSLVSLHKSYVGEPKENIEKFYNNSQLYLYSLKKLNSKSWVQKVEAIRDLSKLNFQDAYNAIYKLTNHKKIQVRKEALTGVVLLKGLSELEHFKETKLYLDNWMQTNFLYSLKIKQWKITSIQHSLFFSENESFLLLIARIVELYSLYDYYDKLYELTIHVKDKRIKHDLSNVISRLK